MIRQEAVDSQASIRQAMEAEILGQGPSRVSRHCADSAQTNVVDVDAAAFSAAGAALYAAEAPSRVDRIIDERGTSNCFHLEIDQ